MVELTDTAPLGRPDASAATASGGSVVASPATSSAPSSQTDASIAAAPHPTSGAFGWKPVAGWMLVIACWAVLPLLVSRSITDMFVFTALYSIAGIGVSFLLGQCGIVSLAQSAFYGIGAYSSAYCATKFGWPMIGGLSIGVVISAALALAIGWQVLKLSGHFLALATLALAIIAQVLFVEWDGITGGTLGIGGVPKLSAFGWTFNTPLRFYYLIWPIALVVLLLHRRLARSRTGLALRAMRDAPAAALVLGIDNQRLKVRIFILSAVLGSLSGSLLAHYVSFVSVDSFGVDRAISFLLIAVLGGARTTFGVVLGALFVVGMPHLLSGFGDISAVLFAVCLIVFIIFLPGGIGTPLGHWLRRIGGGGR